MGNELTIEMAKALVSKFSQGKPVKVIQSELKSEGTALHLRTLQHWITNALMNTGKPLTEAETFLQKGLLRVIFKDEPAALATLELISEPQVREYQKITTGHTLTKAEKESLRKRYPEFVEEYEQKGYYTQIETVTETLPRPIHLIEKLLKFIFQDNRKLEDIDNFLKQGR